MAFYLESETRSLVFKSNRKLLQVVQAIKLFYSFSDHWYLTTVLNTQVIQLLASQDSIDMVIVSDANTIFIEEILNFHGLKVLIFPTILEHIH